jgi:vacuolar-type H+-ATPase subunit E/Vma4
MKELDFFLEKLLKEKEEERKALLNQAQSERNRILRRMEEEAHTQFEVWLKKRQDVFLREMQAQIFDTKQEARGKVLKEKERILNEAFRRLREFIRQNPGCLPKKEIVTKKGRQAVALSEEEVIEFLKDHCYQEIDRFFQV